MRVSNSISMIFMLCVLNLISCDSKEKEVDDGQTFETRILKSILRPIRSGRPFFFTKRGKLASALYHEVYRAFEPQKVKNLLEAGANPNYCRGECGWVDSNPLNVIAEGFYNASTKKQRGDYVPNPIPPVEIMHILVEFGVDINQRPYIWDRVHFIDNSFFDSIKIQRQANKLSVEQKDMKKEIDCFVNDVNIILEAFLQAGADPDMKGHPYPFSYEGMQAGLTEDDIKEYFKNGTRAINVAIEKGMFWGSQVDLLLRYTSLDDESLEAAIRSGDDKMIEKIKFLWED